MYRSILVCAMVLTACASSAEATPTDSGPDFVFIAPTATTGGAATPTDEPLPFRDLSSPTPTESPVPPSPTLAPATAVPVIAATAPPTRAPAQPAVQPTLAPAIQVTAPPAPTPVPPTAIPAAPVSDASSAEQAVIDLSNGFRAQYGLPPLLRDEGIMAIARSRSADMVARGFFGHTDPVTGLNLSKPQILALGYGRSGENIYWSGRGLAEFPAQAVNWFMGDPPHRANILNSNYTATGVGIVWNGVGWTLTQNFGGP